MNINFINLFVKDFLESWDILKENGNSNIKFIVTFMIYDKIFIFFYF